MPQRRRSEPDLLVLAFEQVAERGLDGFSRVDLARAAGVAPLRVYEQFPDRSALVRRLGERLDRAMLDFDAAELDELDRRERLFELVMRRLDAMAPFRAGLRRLARDTARQPRFVLASLCNLDRLCGWLLDAAGIGAGLRARLVAGPVLLAAYVRTFSVWLEDDTPDRARTMAALDRALSRVEPILGLAAARRAPEPSPESEPSGEAA